MPNRSSVRQHVYPGQVNQKSLRSQKLPFQSTPNQPGSPGGRSLLNDCIGHQTESTLRSPQPASILDQSPVIPDSQLSPSAFSLLSASQLASPANAPSACTEVLAQPVAPALTRRTRSTQHAARSIKERNKSPRRRPAILARKNGDEYKTIQEHMPGHIARDQTNPTRIFFGEMMDLGSPGQNACLFHRIPLSILGDAAVRSLVHHVRKDPSTRRDSLPASQPGCRSQRAVPVSVVLQLRTFSSAKFTFDDRLSPS